MDPQVLLNPNSLASRDYNAVMTTAFINIFTDDIVICIIYTIIHFEIVENIMILPVELNSSNVSNL